MNFSKTTSYAISVLSFMADHEKEKFSAKKLNEILEIPWPYLRQLLTKLSKSGFIFSTQGRNGGFQLQKPANKIILADIIEAVEGLEVLNTCIMGFNKCPFNHTCAMHEVWEETRNSILKVLNNTSLDHLKKGGNKG
jgi:Rrf2 family transcriptional regulator, nitric oxide-sensitive transcriptional repressor